MPSLPQRFEFLAHKHFIRDVPPSLRPDLHTSLRKLTLFERESWHRAGVRVKKLAGINHSVFEARLNKGDRLIFTLRARSHTTCLVLWGVGHHDDAVRMATRRMGIETRAMQAGSDWQPLSEFPWEEEIPTHHPLQATDTPEERAPLVELTEKDIDEWAESQLDPILHLSPEQRVLTRVTQDQPVFLRGGVGTGKTTVLLYRMLKLIMAGAIERPVFLTFSKSLAAWCRSVFERLPGARGRTVEFTSLSGWLRANFGATQGGKRLFRIAWEKTKLTTDPESAWWELQRLRGSAAFQGKQPIQGDRLPAHVSPQLKAAYDTYRRLLDGAPDVLDLAWQAYDHYRSTTALMNLPFDAVFIDEAQDLTPIEWLVCILMGHRPNLAFFCGDAGQDVRDTRFSWDGVEAALRLVGYRAPAFAFAQLHGNRRNSHAIAELLKRLSERFELELYDGKGTGQGPPPQVCVAPRKEAERVARRAGCPVLLDLEAREGRQLERFFWALDLDHIKGLEFHVLALWAPASSWPDDKYLAKKLFTATSRAMQGLVIFTDHSTVERFESLGALRSDLRTVETFLEDNHDLIAFDRQMVAKWKGQTLSQAKTLVRDGVCQWSDFRPFLADWASDVSFSTAKLWIEQGLCSWVVFHDRLCDWKTTVDPDLASLWVREGLLLQDDFNDRAQEWVWSANLERAIAWVDSGLLDWEDFKPRIRDWIAQATLPLATSWVESSACRWMDLRHRLPEWVEEATLKHAMAWVQEGTIYWKSFDYLLGQWFDEVDVDTASTWVREGLCTWERLQHRFPSWRDTVAYDDAKTWVEKGFVTWLDLGQRIRSWVSDASFEEASTWVQLGLCSWVDLADRVEPWLPEASAEQAIGWLEEGLCSPQKLWMQSSRWRASLTLSQASVLVEAGACSWYGLTIRLEDWLDSVTLAQASQWVAEGLRSWLDFESRIADWTPDATRELATEWVRLGLCTWQVFESRISSWKPGASFDQARQWVDAGLASWKQFELDLTRWSQQAEPSLVDQWREQGLVSRQVARAARKHRR